MIMRKETRRAEREGIMIRIKMIPTVQIQKNYYRAPQKNILIKKIYISEITWK